MKNYFVHILVAGMFLLSNHVVSQETNTISTEDLEAKILALDATFWNVYNSCNVDKFKQFLTDDLEFYHDKGGLTETSEKLISLVKNGLCKDPNMKLRREAVKGSVNVYPLNNYGAIITGEHLFYLTENGNPERLVEAAKFTHVWKNENGKWCMSRVLSYDHKQASENSKKNAIELTNEVKKALVGTYKAPNTGIITIFMENDKLRIKAGQMNSALFAISKTELFVKEAPLRFKFVKDAKGQIVKFTVFENGKAVEEALRVE
ncbi:nuclear transport factor 2 family protein [Kordia jejudonensis]|uniref:nuclear transport factor 2 family protein n=1 Tax=Kordia jejudonensis TaxID=1348245 RepID=UPI00069CB753|nr:DUF4440 domain-containing protein [Kordia jejudonensis]